MFWTERSDRLCAITETLGQQHGRHRLDLDCDGDAILATVHPHGPTCHQGTRSCFDAAASGGATSAGDATAAPSPQGFAWLETLWATIEERRRTRPAGSYTTSLLDGGVDAAGRKVTEEATELLMAAKDDAATQASGLDRTATQAALSGEAADLIFHALVLLAERGVAPASVVEVLRGRHRD
ncbi:MAG: phosphoribosyl-AMP cyclohydrolase / Phosphoribosyl-ATP pyrophosphatase [Chloroflexi bacterium]|nr:phosphoribosyl-AMP cyclohydrolase / Phosphoribosyl-ATP pyrophosphatase [Chloroflexota bacterium]